MESALVLAGVTLAVLVAVNGGASVEHAKAIPGPDRCQALRATLSQIQNALDRIAESRRAQRISRELIQQNRDSAMRVLRLDYLDPEARERFWRHLQDAEQAAQQHASRAQQLDYEEIAIQNALEETLQQWIDDNCGDPPALVCATAAAASFGTGLPPSAGTRPSRRELDLAEGDARPMLDQLTRPVGPIEFGTIRADGTIAPINFSGEGGQVSVLDRAGGLPITFENSTFRTGEGVALARYRYQRADGGGTVELVRVVGETGQSGIPSSPGYDRPGYSSTAGYLDAFWVLPTVSTGPTVRAVARAEPLIRFGVAAAIGYMVFRAVGRRAAMTLEILLQTLQRNNERYSTGGRADARRYLRRCGFHVELEVASADQPRPSRNPISISRAVKTAALPPTSTTPSTEPPEADPPTEDPISGGGTGIVHYVGNNCGSLASGRWDFRTFVGSKENGKGFGIAFGVRTRGTRSSNISDIETSIYTLSMNEVDWNKPDVRSWWERWKAQMKSAIRADLGLMKVKLSDPDGLGEGSNGYLIISHPGQARAGQRAFRLKIKRGCQLQPSPYYRSSDAP